MTVAIYFHLYANLIYYRIQVDTIVSLIMIKCAILTRSGVNFLLFLLFVDKKYFFLSYLDISPFFGNVVKIYIFVCSLAICRVRYERGVWNWSSGKNLDYFLLTETRDCFRFGSTIRICRFTVLSQCNEQVRPLSWAARVYAARYIGMRFSL